MIYKASNEAIRFYDDYKYCKVLTSYSLMASEAENKAKNQTREGKGLKTSTPKQFLQRLPTALVQVKPNCNSENLLNESDKSFILCTNQKNHL